MIDVERNSSLWLLPLLLVVLASLGLVPLGGCSSLDDYQGTYVETVRIDEERDFAIQLTFFRFGNDVGGVVRFYDLVGRYLGDDPRDTPYGNQAYCSYFGSETVTDNAFSFQTDGPGEQQYYFRFENITEEDSLTGHFSPVGGVETSTRLPLILERETTSTDQSCSPPGEFEFVASFSPRRLSEYPDLSVAVTHSWYQLNEQDDVRLINHWNEALAIPVSGDVEGLSVGEVTLQLPSMPDLDIMSPESDPSDQPVARYAIGYVVLFDDDNSGTFHHLVDEVLDVSLGGVAIYVAGSPNNLHQSVREVFSPLSHVPSDRWAIYSVADLETDGQNAFMSRVGLALIPWIPLTPVAEGEQPVYPILMPLDPL